jgi:hypothetical protein
MLVMGPLAFIAAALGDIGGMFEAGLQHRAIQYYTRPVADPVYELDRKIQSGERRLKFEGSGGYLRSLLEALNIPIESQLLVFSKTSLLARLISPEHPRSVFFNDSVMVTWIPGEPFVELAAQDPQQGVIFYALDNRPVEKPTISRHNGDCLNCHNSIATLGVPGVTVRSVLASASGTPMSYLGDTFPDHRTPFAERWGGWYVTGKNVPAGHRGNSTINVEGHASFSNLKSLQGRLDSGAYVTPYSDVVALMVFEHQIHAMNLLTRVSWDVRVAMNDGPPERAKAVLEDRTNELVDYLLFADEWPLTAKIEGNSGFTERFSAEGPRDSKGRSLREFDLENHLMRYPCSYMIYSAAFDGLPSLAKASVYRRMWQNLSGEKRDARYARYSRGDGQAVLEILRETKPEVRDYFRP